MPREDRKPLEGSIESTEDSIKRAAPAAAASYTLIGAILLCAAIGYAIDQWRGGGQVFLVSGLILGMVVGFYELARSVWKR
jgi:F0F1-type ATP synthase assembly protein I